MFNFNVAHEVAITEPKSGPARLMLKCEYLMALIAQ